MSTYKINAEVNFGSNISKLVNQINSEVKKISAIKIGVNKNDINQIKAAIGGISSSFNSIGRNNNLSRSINDISRAAKTGSRDFKLLSSSIANSHNELEKFGRSTGATIRRFSAFVGVVTIFNGIKDAFRDSAKEAINFEKEMIKVAQVTGFAFKDLGDLDREITRLSTTLGVSSSKLLNVSLTLAQAGITAKDTKKALDVLAKTELSATFTNIQDTTEAAIAVMAQFGTTTGDLEKQLGAINTVSAKFAVESGDLTTAIRKAGGAFQATGGDLNELIALFTSVRATTRESADAIATGLRTIFTRLQRPRTLNFLEELGITLRNDAGEFIGVYQAVEKLSGALKNISGTDPRFNQIVEELGGFRQVSRVIPLLKEFETSQKALAAAQRAGNSVNDDAITAQKSLANQIARVKEEFNALVRSILNDAAFRKTTEFVLGLASAFIKVADSVRPLIPLLAIAGTAFTIKNTGSFIGGVRKELFDVKEAVKTIGPRKGFNRGGLVPGSGSGDTVPAMLEPGEFVLRKSAVNALGKGEVGKLNKFAGGGRVNPVEKIFREDSTGGFNSLLEKQRASLGYDSTYNVRKHAGINTSYINKFVSNDKNSIISKEEKLKARELASATRKFEFDHDLVTYSGLDEHSSDIVNSLLKEGKGAGKTFTLSRFLSTSAQPFVARDFAKDGLNTGKKTLLRIRNFKGQKGLVRGDSLEKEIILPNRSSFKILRSFDADKHKKNYHGDEHSLFENGNIIDVERFAKGGRVGISKKSFNNISNIGDLSPRPRKIIKDILNSDSSQALDYIPKNSKYLSSGTEGIVFVTPDKRVIRLGLLNRQEKTDRRTFLGRSKEPEMLQPLFSRKFNNVLLEQLPYVDTLSSLRKSGKIDRDTSDKYTRQISESVMGKGLGVEDNHDDNIGLLNGKPIFIDPGTIVDKRLKDFREKREHRYAKGGKVRELFGKFLGNGPKIQDQVKDLFSKGGFKRSLGLDDSQPLFSGLLSDNGYTSLPQEKIIPSKNKQILNYARKTLNTLQKDLGVEFDKNIVSKLVVTNNIQKHTADKNASGYRGFYNSGDKRIVLNSKLIKNKNDVRDLIGHEFGHAVDQLAGQKRYPISSAKMSDIDANVPKERITGKLSDFRDTASNRLGNRRGEFLRRRDDKNNLKFTNRYSEYRYSAREGFAEVFRRYAQDPRYREVLNKRGFDEILKLVSTPKRFAKGGGVGTDTVPALLTPGEFVVNKKSAQAFGYDNLKKVNKYAKGGIVDKIGSLGIGGAIFGPQLVAEGAKSAGLGDFSQLVGPLSLATAGLVAFSTILKKDTDSLEDHITALKEDLTSNKVTQSDITDEAKTRRLAGIKDIQTRPFRELKTEISSLKSKRAGLEKEFNNPNQKIADLAFNKAIKIDSKIESLKNNFIKNLPSTRANIRQDIGSYSQANKSFRDVDLEKLKLSRIKLEDELVKKQKQLAADTRSEKVGNIAAIGGSIAIAAGAGISSFSNANAVNGERKTGGLNTSTVGAIGGALQSGGAGAVGGAIVGAQLTAWLGPHAAAIGAALGAAAGAIYGGVSEFQRIESQLNQVDFTKKFDKFSTQINSVLSGKATPQSQRGNISDFAKTANQAFLTTTGDEFTTLKGQVGGSVEAISAYINKTLDANKSTDSLIKENEDLILLLSRFGNQSIKELEDGIKKEINIRQVALKQENRYIKIQEENNRRLSAIFGISGSIGDAQRSVHNVNAVLDSLGQFADGLGIISTRFDFSALDDVGSSNLGDVTRQASLAGNLIGGPANGLAQDIISATKTVGDLPLLLNRLVNTNQFEGKDLGLELQDAFKEANTKGGKPQELDFAQKLILEKFEKVVGGTGNTTEFLKRFNENPVDVIKELQSAIDPMVSVFKENAPKIQSELDGYSEGLSKGTDRFLRALDGLIESIDIEDVASQMEAAFKGKTRSFDEAQSFDAKKLSELGGNSSVSELGNRLNAAQSTILRFQDILSEEGDVAEQKALREAISKNVEEAEKVRRALEFSADVNSRLANVQQELEKITRTKELKKDLVKDFVFGDAQAKRNVTKGLLAAAQVDNNLNKGVDPFKGLSPELVEMARSTFERFGDSKLFNGQTGNERLDAVAKAKGFDVGKNTSEFDKLKASSDKILEDAKTAREILNKNLQSRNEEFLTGLSTRFDQFFANLNKSFIDRENKSKADERAVKDNKIAGIDINIDKLKSLQRMIGGGINLNEDRGVEQLKNNLSLGKEAKSIEDKKSEAGRLFRNLKDVSNRDLSGVLDNEKFKTVSRSLNGKTGDERTEIIGPALIDAIKQLNIESIDKKNQLEGNVGPETAKALANFPDRIEKILKPIENNKGISTLEKEKTTYKADGGMVWKKRGSDTVPAMTTDSKPYMLTPGEYVMKRSAVQKYGIGFMKKVNMGYLSEGGNAGGLTGLFQSVGMIRTPKKKQFYSNEYHVPSNKKYGDGIDASLLGKQYAAKKREEAAAERRLANKSGEELEANRLDEELVKQGTRIAKTPNKPAVSVSDIAKKVENTWTPLAKNADRLAANNALTHIPVLPRRDTSFVDMMSAKRLEGERVKKNRNNISFGSDRFRPNEVALKRLQYQGTVKDNIAFGMSPKDAKRKAIGMFSQDGNQRDRFQREKNDLVSGGMSPKEASRKLLAEYKNDKDRFAPPKSSGGSGFFNVPPEKMSPMDRKNEEAYQSYNPLEQGIIRGAEEQGTPQNNKLRAALSGRGYIAGENGYSNAAYPGQSFKTADEALSHIKQNRGQSSNPQPKVNIPNKAKQNTQQNPIGLNKTPVQEVKNAAQPQTINPKIIEDFNKAVDKLAGTKLELAISGSLSINITDGALTDKVKEGFRVAVQQYTDDKITQAINQLIGDAGLAVVPRPVGRKEGK